jgi:hypothetical protein
MTEWLQLTEAQRRAVLKDVSGRTGLAMNAIEKDWWVTLSLRACFLTPWKDNLVFKGGTSLSKAWGLIERFSEDIDLVLDREVLGFKGELTKSQIKKLREKAAAFIAAEFLSILNATLLDIGVDPKILRLEIQPGGVADRDPQILQLYYRSVLEPNDYLADKVTIEIGARSLLEPASERAVHSIIGIEMPDQPFSSKPYYILTVDPRRTFFEKIFLLHEEFSKSKETIRHERMSRHLYDLEKLMDSPFGHAAVANPDLYKLIVQHRERYTPIRGLDYSRHAPGSVDFIPPPEVLDHWERDYGLMQQAMIYGESPSFKVLLERMKELQKRIRAMAG